METLERLQSAFEGIEAARRVYLLRLRAAVADGVTQADIARQLGVSREKLRKDLLPDERRQAFRATDAARKRAS